MHGVPEAAGQQQRLRLRATRDGRVLGEYTERNPEDWSEFGL